MPVPRLLAAVLFDASALRPPQIGQLAQRRRRVVAQIGPFRAFRAVTILSQWLENSA